MLGGEPDRDSLRTNMDVLKLAAQSLGLRVGVKTCQLHIQALYDYMQIPCPGHLEHLGHPFGLQFKLLRLGIVYLFILIPCCPKDW